MSRNRVNSVRNEHAGNFSCGSQLFETPIQTKHEKKIAIIPMKMA